MRWTTQLILETGGRAFRDVGSMAVRTLFRSGLIEKNCFRFHDAAQFVATRAFHVLVCPTQGKIGSLVMVKQGRLPFRTVVAFSAACYVALSELLAVNVLMAVLTLFRRSLEVDIDQAGFKVGRLVTVDASSRAVRSQ